MAREILGGVLRPVLVGGLLVTTMALACATPASADWLGGERPVTAGSGTQQWPQLSGSRLVYTEESEDGGFDVRVRDLDTGTDTDITSGHSATGRAAISGNRVVWADSGEDAGIWFANLATGQRLRLSVGVGERPSISGTRVCYTALGDVHVHDVRTGSDRVVSEPRSDASNCDISGDTVVWQDDRFGSADIFSYNLRTDTATRITSDLSAQTMPRVDGDVVVWQDDRNGADDADIVGLDLATGARTLICGAPGAQSFPEVSRGRVVWTDGRFGHGNVAIFLYDFRSGVETRVSDHDGWSGDPAISGDRIVYEHVLGGGHHLFVRTVTPPVLTSDLTPFEAGGQPGLGGHLIRRDGLPVVGVAVELEASADGKDWADVGSSVTAGDGGYDFSLPVSPLPTWFRVRFDGSRDVAPAVGEPVWFEGVR